MSSNNLYSERLERCKKAIMLEKPDRVPVICKTEPTYAIQYAGYNLKKALWDIDLLIKAMDKLYEDFYFDAGGFMGRFPLFYKITGSKTIVPNDRDGYMQHPEVTGLKAEEYDEYIEDPYKCIIEKIVPRLYTELGKPGIEGCLNWARAIYANNIIKEKIAAGNAMLSQKHGIASIRRGITEAPLDFIADFIRGFTGISKDMRRYPEKVRLAAEASLPLMIKLAKLTNPTPGIIPSVFIPLHMPPYMRTIDFEKLYWPTFEKLCRTLTSEGYTLQIFFEKNWTRYYDYLQELPKGIIGYFEEDDLGVVKEKLGKTMCIMGNFPVNMLKLNTKQECIDKAKEIIDKAAPGGGYMFTVDKSILLLNDAKPENLRAVNEFVHEYGTYK
ncbi:MAG: uroporphyrinogen decarboxylase [Firmicutes bacterium]|nr:uroporphyrinogen decarboxylase [Bacillota bacterium]